MAVIRAMAPEDIDDILKLAAETREAPHWDRSAYEHILAIGEQTRTSRAAWVAADGSNLLGFAVVHRVAEICELESIVVAKSARRKGIGKSLLDVAVEWSLASGAQKLELEVRAGNESAIAFYEIAGLRHEGLRIHYYSDPPEDAVLMGKRL